MRRLGAVVIGLSLTTALLVWWLSSPVPVPSAPEPRPVQALRAQPPLSQGEGRIEGRVVCSHDVADLAGTEIVFELHGQRATVDPAADGRFVFTTSQDGTWTISAIRAPGHVARPVDSSFLLGPGVVIAGVELRVDAVPSASVEPGAPRPDTMVPFAGVVVDEADHPVAGALIDGASRTRPGGPNARASASRGEVRFTATSDAEGRFQVEVPEGALVSLRASLDTRASERAVFPSFASPRLRLRTHESALSGRVVDREGQPITAFRVRLRALDFNAMKTVSSPEGAYRLDRLPRGPATVEVSASGFLEARREAVALTAEERTGVDFVLERGLTLAGVVLDEKTLQPLERAVVRANQVKGGMDNGTARTDERGAFVVQGLPPGRVELWAWHEGYRGREVLVEAGAQGAVRITLAEGPDQPRAMDYEGVGMQFDSAARLDAGQGYRVSRLHPEGGARVAGLELGDEILAADGLSADSVPVQAFMRQIKGPEGTVVTLTVRRGGRTFELHAARRRLFWAP